MSTTRSRENQFIGSEDIMWNSYMDEHRHDIHKVCHFLRKSHLLHCPPAQMYNLLQLFFLTRLAPHLLAEVRIQFQITPFGICRAESVTRTGISPSASAFSCLPFLQSRALTCRPSGGMWSARQPATF
jgi:hypothetical protein